MGYSSMWSVIQETPDPVDLNAVKVVSKEVGWNRSFRDDGEHWRRLRHECRTPSSFSRLRKRLRVKREVLARESGIPLQTIERMENGKVPITRDMLKILFKVARPVNEEMDSQRIRIVVTDKLLQP